MKWKLVVGDSRKMEHMKANNTSLPNKQLNFESFGYNFIYIIIFAVTWAIMQLYLFVILNHLHLRLVNFKFKKNDKNLFQVYFCKISLFCKWIMVRHLAECNKKANLCKKIKNHFRKPFLDLERSNFAESVFRLIRNYCKFTFCYSENRLTLLCTLHEQLLSQRKKHCFR